ncbi:MAG: hypothetical protein K0R17_3827 [Rariglobus sp.]|nr:hypothetical protein [Rariglobus sp.]
MITVTLLAFLVLLLVSLASLSRVETQVASNNQIIAQARQNALLAMNIAIGQLQRYAGPDNRVTAQASLTGAAVQNPWFTGVWDADTASPTATTWLVSGNETAALAINQATSLNRTAAEPDVALTSVANPGRVRLVGPGSARMSALGSANIEHGAVVVPAVAIQAEPPGMAAGTLVTVGRYAWWVGDQGVKASLGLADRADDVTYAPWSTSTLRNRIRQQIGSSPNYFRGSSAVSGLSTVRTEGFDPLSNATSPSLLNVVANEQLALLTPAGGTVKQVDFVKDRYHDFTTAAFSVLANTRASTDAYRGLMLDLSTKPSLLGTAFAKYADYSNYMKLPEETAATDPLVPSGLLIASADSPRRRYKTQPLTTNAATGLPEIAFSVAPVLANFVIQFQVRRISASNPALQIRSKVYATMWNPYATALVPPSNLRLEITGLPTIMVKDSVDASSVAVAVDLQSTSPVLATGLSLPFSKADRYSGSTSFGADGELATWLPGRVYSWTTASGATAGPVLGFYNNSMSMTGWTHTVASAPTGSALALSVDIPEVSATPLTVKVLLGTDIVATYTAKYDADEVPNSNVSTTATADYWCFGFTFRLNQPRDYDLDRSWLTRTDPRSASLTQADAADAEVLIPFNTRTTTSPLPSKYIGTIVTTDSTGTSNLNGNLIHRVQGQNARAMSTYNDVSLFELPRLPLLSAGELQHLQIKDKRPFSIGNPWGGTANAIFDRFFFSGLPLAGAGTLPDLTANQPLPNWNLKPVGITTAAAIVAGDVEQTASHLLQGGGFNINSTSIAAWRAVLSSARFSAAKPMVVADIVNASGNTDPNAGTQNDAVTRSETFISDPSMGVDSSPVFFRFPQTAQEVFYWADPSPGSGISGNARKFYTSAFRQGVRGYNASTPFTGAAGTFSDPGATGAKMGTSRQHVTADQVEVLANEIVRRLRIRAAAAGPFRNLETFLSETTVFGVQPGEGRSLLEDAIDAAGMNAAEVKPVATALAADHSGLSSLTLTQADLLTATAPYLRTRSDTFTVRTYGEVINPLTSAVEGKAWAEATVQRYPETVSATDSVLQPGAAGNVFGRRFKIISFRWLTSTDI